MDCRHSFCSAASFRLPALALLLGLSLALFASLSTVWAATSDAITLSPVDYGNAVASQHGKVVFFRSGDAQKQIFIIGQNHLSPLTGSSNDKTMQAQLDIYRIGEWLIRQRKVALLLPEGFFGWHQPGEETSQGAANAVTGGGPLFRQTPDDDSLRARLSASNASANAAILLNADYGVRFAQVEDKGLYGAVAESFQHLSRQAGSVDAALFSQLSCFQERRSAAMLQNIPSVIQNEFQSGNIASQQAVFIVGMAHIAEIIQYLDEERITLTPGRAELVRSTPCELTLMRENYGVTVILPRSLAEDEEVLRLTKLLGKIPE